VAAAIFALLISSEAFETAVLLKKEEFRFIVPAAALLGGIIGAVIPERYRRHKAQQLILKRQPIDLACIINECQNTLAQRLNQSRITLNIQSSAEKAMVDVDPCRIQQVFMGLLTNALEYSHPEHTIGISWEHGRNTDTVQVAIADSGTGISQNKLLEIRESFEQQDTQWLYFINNDIPADLNQIHFILTLHNGTIEMERNEAGGTTVRISLPAAKQSAERITELAPDLQATSDTDEAAKKEEPVVMIS
jgi:K+-sensing histidine kinase KdpD